MHQRRVSRMLLLGSAVTAAASLFWGAFFVQRGDWLAVGLDALAVALAATTVLLTRRGHLRAASRLLIAVLFLVLSFNALVFDIPTLAVPRSAHQFLLALGVVSCLLTREEPAWLRHGIPIACFLAYLGFSATNVGWLTPLALPESVRIGGNWLNAAIALATIYAALQVMQSDVAKRNQRANELRDALLHDELQLHYQPQVDAGDRVFGAEALVRWRHPRRGLISPAEFIPLAESSGLMTPLGDWVLRSACAQLVRWAARDATAHLVLAVNVSASQFEHPGFVARVLAIVEQSGAEPSRLKLELTESMLAHDLEDIIAKMGALKARGIGFSLDDFGTGYSSLSYLRRLPLDQLKIDQSFVREMLTTSKDAAIAETVIALGRSLGLNVIAEGVETAAQRQFLADLGCLAYQGYLFSRPLPVAEFDALLASRASLPVVAEALPPRRARAAIPSAAAA
jgi:EAL domain-containing protein (putative c-di-GMP-specific phosphodiesterase class I)